jgi:hypothetical protein
MKINKWTQVLLGVGLVSIPAVTHAEEQLSSLRTELTSTTISGYVDTTATWKFGTGNANMPGRTYDQADTQDGFNLNVVSITFAKPLDESEWAAGYTVQTLMGPGAIKRGTRSLAGGPGGDFAFNEAVVLLRVPIGNGLDLKVGQFGTYNGYEAYDTYKNPNWSRSYGFFIESSAHTGVSASYKFADWMSVMAGVGNMAGFNNAVDARYSQAISESEKAYLAMVTFTAPESFGFMKGASLSMGYTGGKATPTAQHMQENYYVGLSMPTPVDALAVGVAFDYTTGIGGKDEEAGALGTYFLLQATEKLKVNTRLDYGWGDSGQYYTAKPGKKNQLLSLTVTADYSLWQNVISRLEFRADRALTGGQPFGGTITTTATPPVVGNPNDRDALSLTGNLIYQF